jgi:hypothetical protein
MCAKCATDANGLSRSACGVVLPAADRFLVRRDGHGTYEGAYPGPYPGPGAYAPAGGNEPPRAYGYGHPAGGAAEWENPAVSGGRHGRPRRSRTGGGGGGARRLAGDAARLPGPLLRRRAERFPSLVPALPYEPREGDATGTAGCSFAELDRRARAVAARLGSLLTPGSRVLLVYPEGADLAGAFFGCLYAGMTAIPLPQPGPGSAPGVPRAVQRCAPDLVLTGTDAWYALAVDRSRTQVVEADGVRVGGEPVWRLAQQWRPVGVLHGAPAYQRYHDDGAAGGRLEAAMDHGDLSEVLTELAQAVRLGTDEENVGWIAAVHGMEEAVWRILLPVRVTG